MYSKKNSKKPFLITSALCMTVIILMFVVMLKTGDNNSSQVAAASASATPSATDLTSPAASGESVTTGPAATTSPTKAPIETETPAPTSAPDDSSDIVSFTFTASGDNLIHSCLYEQAAARGRQIGQKYDFKYCYKLVKGFFLDHDMNWINQETLVNGTYAPAGYPNFSTPTQVVKDLREDGFTVFNTASNHSYDKLSGGLSASMDFWNKMARKGEGKDAYQVGIVKRSKPLPQLIREINGVKVGFLSYTYGTNGISIASDSTYRVVTLSERSLIQKQVKALRKKVDVVMVSCHWGVENSHTISSDQKSLAKDLVEWGADVIIGTHPHVLQDCSWIKSGGRKGFCAYSLGNFISGQVETDQILGGTLHCTIDVNKKTGIVKIRKPKLKPVVTIYGSGRSGIHVKWLAEYSSDDAAFQSSHISQASFINLAKRVVKKKFLDI
ncbi:MAG: CapA family protein [Eubacterium sp.]|nr:CapA family protein [Eubacterium sp.]